MRDPLSVTLPKTLELFKESAPPEYLIWPSENKKKQRQLSAAFEDNIETGINWQRVLELRSKYDSALAYCLEAPVMVENVPVYILGITHSSDHSAEHVSEAITQLNPKIVCIESCVDRTQARVAIQLPLVEQYECDWPTITALGDEGSPSLEDLARHGLLDGSMDVAQFMVASGSIQGCPELTALFECKQRRETIQLESIDVLESVKLVQNASIDACGYTSRRQGDLSEGVLRQVIDEEGILSEYLRLMYGEKGMSGISVQPSSLYRLLECRKRSGPFADFLLRELHRLFRSRQYWSRIFLRDLYMSLRIRRQCLASERRPVLVIVGGAHVEGIRDILSSPPEIETHTAMALSVLIDNAETLIQVWREVFGLDLFTSLINIPRRLDNANFVANEIAKGIISGGGVSVWLQEVGEWQIREADESLLMKGLVDGIVDPYTVRRLEAQAANG